MGPIGVVVAVGALGVVVTLTTSACSKVLVVIESAIAAGTVVIDIVAGNGLAGGLVAVLGVEVATLVTIIIAAV